MADTAGGWMNGFWELVVVALVLFQSAAFLDSTA
jgi:hypothetical protein